MARQRCLKCGKLKELANSTTCIECQNKIEPFIKEIKFNRVEICRVCGAYAYSKEWHNAKLSRENLSRDNLIINVLRKGLKINRYYTLKSLDFKIKKESEDAKKQVFSVFLHMKLHDEKTFQYSKKVKFIIVDSICPKCQKQLSNYFEGIIQLRGKDNEQYSEAEKDLRSLIQKKSNVEVTKVVSTKHGIDLYVTNKRVMQDILAQLHKKYGGHIEQNSKLFSYNHQKSKAIYRVNALIRLPDFNINDILEIKGSFILVRKVSGSKVTGFDLASAKERQFDFEKTPYEVAFQHQDIKFKTTISKVYPDIEILNDNYESTPVIDLSNKKRKLRLGSKVNIVKFKNRYYLI